MTGRRIGTAALLAVAAYAGGLRRHQLTWGASSVERRAALPGDQLVADADLVATRCIDVHTEPARVWPWIAQLGQGRGGFYSYDALENLIGCDVHSAERIVAAWQHPEVGDAFRLHPEVALEVAMVDPGHALVVRGAVPAGGTKGAPPYDFTWAFVVREVAPDATRVLVRERYAYTRWWAPALVEPVSVVSWAMTRKMLHGIRERAERPD